MKMDSETACANMIEQQIRPWNVLAMQTLHALKQIRREDFVPAEHRELAFADVRIPLGGGEVMFEPKVSARMVESLGLGADDRVLEVGTGSGWVTALLASLCAQVTSVEIDQKLLAGARRNLAKAGIENVTLENGDAHAGWGAAVPFDAILINGSLPSIIDAPDHATEVTGVTEATASNPSNPWSIALADGGRLVGIEGHPPAMQVVRLTKNNGSITRASLFETVAPRLRNILEPAQFVF